MGLGGLLSNKNELAPTKLTQRVLKKNQYIYIFLNRGKSRRNPLCELFITRTYNNSTWYGSSFVREMTTKPSIPKHIKGSKERYLLGQDKTSNFRGNPLGQATKRHLNN